MIESGKNIKTFLSGTDICLSSQTFMSCYYKVNLDRRHVPPAPVGFQALWSLVISFRRHGGNAQKNHVLCDCQLSE